MAKLVLGAATYNHHTWSVELRGKMRKYDTYLVTNEWDTGHEHNEQHTAAVHAAVFEDLI